MLLTLLLLLPHGVVWDDFECCCTPDRSSTKLVATVCHLTNVRVAPQPNKDAVSVIRLLAARRRQVLAVTETWTLHILSCHKLHLQATDCRIALAFVLFRTARLA